MLTPKLEKGCKALPCCKLDLPWREANQSMPNNCDTDQNSASDERPVPWLSPYFCFTPDIFWLVSTQNTRRKFNDFIAMRVESRSVKNDRGILQLVESHKNAGTGRSKGWSHKLMRQPCVFAEYHFIITIVRAMNDTAAVRAMTSYHPPPPPSPFLLTSFARSSDKTFFGAIWRRTFLVLYIGLYNKYDKLQSLSRDQYLMNTQSSNQSYIRVLLVGIGGYILPALFVPQTPINWPSA